LENIVGSLKNALSQVDTSTVLHAHEIVKERRDNVNLRNQWFWTADFPMYRMEDGEAVLYFAPREHNYLLKNIDDAIAQIKATGNYKLKPEDIDAVVKSAESGITLKVKLFDLKLQKHDDEFSYFEIDTKNYRKLNKSQRALAERVHGAGKEFSASMKMLNKAGIGKTKIYVLNPEYVKENTTDGAIGRASWLGSFGNDSIFRASSRNIDSNYGCLRGVRDVTAEGGAQKNMPDEYHAAYRTVISHPEKLTPANAIELLQMVSGYLGRNKQ